MPNNEMPERIELPGGWYLDSMCDQNMGLHSPAGFIVAVGIQRSFAKAFAAAMNAPAKPATAGRPNEVSKVWRRYMDSGDMAQFSKNELCNLFRYINGLEAQLAAAPVSPTAESAWQPIETAPKEDGVYYLVRGPQFDGGCAVVWWDSEAHSGDGWWFLDDGKNYEIAMRGDVPTGWMPLPGAAIDGAKPVAEKPECDCHEHRHQVCDICQASKPAEKSREEWNAKDCALADSLLGYLETYTGFFAAPWLSIIQKHREEYAAQQAQQSVDGVREAYEEALTPSAETKAAYIGEFSFAHGEDGFRVMVPWTTTKEIMAAIKERALAATAEKQEE